MIKNVIFDLDGTLVDSIEGIEFSLKEAIHQELPDQMVRLDGLRRKLGPPISRIIKDLLPNISEDIILFIEKRFRFIYDQEGWKKTQVFDTVPETLSELAKKNIKMYIATLKPSIPTSQILVLTGLASYFSDSISSNLDENLPHKKMYIVNKLITRHNININNSLMVGDTLHDAEAAQSCGLDFVLATYGYGDISKIDKYQVKNRLYRPIDLLDQI